MSGKGARYLSFLLRLWQSDSHGDLIWRASLESPGTGERRGFADLQDLVRFLERQTGHTLLPADQVDDNAGPDTRGGEHS
jgi:hypothetical protein